MRSKHLKMFRQKNSLDKAGFRCYCKKHMKKNGIKNPSRRSFIKKVVVGGIAVTSVAGAAKKVAKLAADDVANKANLNDDLRQDKIMMQKRYALMTKKEKEQMVKTLVDSYKERA